MKKRPNILWIVSDHQVHHGLSSLREYFPLQHRLSQLGQSFERAYSVLPICSPARASMLTGVFPHTHGLTENDGRFGGRSGMSPDDWMVHRPLLDAGYRCGWFGKWHIDNNRSANDYGFEGFSLPGYGYPYLSDEYHQYLARHDLGKPVTTIEISNEGGLLAGSEIDLTQDTDWVDCVSGVGRIDKTVKHESWFVSELASKWLATIGEDNFFLRVDPWGPHPPYLLSDEFAGMLDGEKITLPPSFHSDLSHRPQHHRDYRDYWREAVDLQSDEWLKQYQRALEHIILVETALVRLLDQIDLENTLIIFNSDHGDAISSNGGVANKGDLMVEATMRIPLKLAGPGIKQGRHSNQLVSQLDLVPTILDLTETDRGAELPGRSLRELFDSSNKLWPNSLMAQHYGLVEPVIQRAWYEDDWKMVVGRSGECELYNLAQDEHELQNLALVDGYIDIRQQLEKNLISYLTKVGDQPELFFPLEQ